MQETWVFNKFDVVFWDDSYVTLDVSVRTPYFQYITHSSYYFSKNVELCGFQNKSDYERKMAFIRMFQRCMKEHKNY